VSSDEIAELDDLDRLDGVPAQPVAADLGIRRKGLLRQAIGDDSRVVQALEPGLLDGVDP
jgi:hypothetical protein